MFRIEVPELPPSLNRFAGRKNSWEYRGLKVYWTTTITALALDQRPPVPYDRAVVHIHYTFPDARRRDPDNYCGKLLMDGLTKAGIIADDSFAHIELHLSASMERKVSKTTITVEELT